MASQEDRDQTMSLLCYTESPAFFFFGFYIYFADTMKRTWLVLVFFGCALFLFYLATVEDQPKNNTVTVFRKHLRENKELNAEDTNWLKRRSARAESITPLGNWLLSDEGNSPPVKTTNRSLPFLILVWQHGPLLERRHVRRFSRDKKFSPWESCSVQNCELSYKSTNLHIADAVIFHLHRTSNAHSIPRRKNPNQRWIFLTDESPYNTFLQRNQSLNDYDGLFNWSMTYRIDSDVPVPYGRTIFKIAKDAKFNAKRLVGEKMKLVAVLGSNCAGKNKRWDYVAKLKNVLGEDLKILGHCENGDRTICPGHFEADCPALSIFKFYLAFENSNCREYITEKVFWNSYSKLAVPVIMGAPKIDCELLLPPNSYLHVDDFASPSSLADYLRYLGNNDDEYLKYHAWRTKYRVINEHGYFASASRHYCRVCEALNYNPQTRKIYRRLRDFWSSKADCQN